MNDTWLATLVKWVSETVWQRMTPCIEVLVIQNAAQFTWLASFESGLHIILHVVIVH